jgi:hypothetical protein
VGDACPICHREKAPKASYCYVTAEQMGERCHAEWAGSQWGEEARCHRIGFERLRTALTDIVTLCMDVPATEDWRAKVGDKARKALYGEPGWKQT